MAYANISPKTFLWEGTLGFLCSVLLWVFFNKHFVLLYLKLLIYSR